MKETNIKNEVGNKLFELRKEKGLKQEDVAQAVGITRASLSYYEKGERSVDIEVLYKLCRFYDISIDYLFGISKVKKPNMDIKAIADNIGLSEDAINILRTETTLRHNHTINSLNLLICDMYRQAEGRRYRPFIELFANYLNFHDDNKKIYALSQKGNVKEAQTQAMENGIPFWDSKNLYITQKQKEKLFLMEMENILKILKEEYDKNPNFLE